MLPMPATLAGSKTWLNVPATAQTARGLGHVKKLWTDRIAGLPESDALPPAIILQGIVFLMLGRLISVFRGRA